MLVEEQCNEQEVLKQVLAVFKDRNLSQDLTVQISKGARPSLLPSFRVGEDSSLSITVDKGA